MVTFLLYIHKDTRYLKVAPDTNKVEENENKKFQSYHFG